MNNSPQRPRVSVRLIRQAAAIAEVDDRTGFRIVYGMPTRPTGRARFLGALAELGVDVTQLRTSPDLAPGEPDRPLNPKIEQALADFDHREAVIERLLGPANGGD